MTINLATNDKNETGDEAYLNEWQPFAIEACKKLAPDMILSDIFSRVGFVAADQIGIPGIVINALPWAFCI